jgi:hypothetical protein
MKNIIKSFIKKFTREPATQLGRWNIDTCVNKTNKKIDLANEDHCGPCGEYVAKKLSEKTQSKK